MFFKVLVLQISDTKLRPTSKMKSKDKWNATDRNLYLNTIFIKLVTR